MHIANLYRTLRNILDNSNVSLKNKGLNEVKNFGMIASEIDRLGGINRLPYLLGNEITAIIPGDLNSVTTIGDYAFRDCTSLTSITIPNSVTSIGNYAFQFCERLARVIIGSGIWSIGIGCFNTIRNFSNIYFYSATPPVLHTFLGSTNTFKSSITIHVPVGSGDAYKSATNWSAYASQIVEDIVIE
jgi:hypothetical protein